MKFRVNVTLADGEGTRYESGRSYDLPDDERTAGWLANGFIEVDDAKPEKKSGKKKAAKKAKADPDLAPVDDDDEADGEDEDEEEGGDGSAPVELRGAALDEALVAADLSKSGTVAEKQARLAEHAAAAGSDDNTEETDVDEKSIEPKDEAATAAKAKAKKATTTRRAPRTTEKG